MWDRGRRPRETLRKRSNAGGPGKPTPGPLIGCQELAAWICRKARPESVDPRTEIAAVERRKAQPRKGQTRFIARRSNHRAEAALRSLFAQRGQRKGK